MAPSLFHSSGNISTLGSARGGFVGILTYQSVSALLHLGKLTTSCRFGIEPYQSSQDIQMCYVLPPVFALVLSKFLAEHVTGKFRHLLGSPCWMEAPYSSQHVGRHSSLLSFCTKSCQEWASGLSAQWSVITVLTLLMQRCLLCRQGFSSSVCQVVAGVT